MSEKKIIVPEGMLKAAEEAIGCVGLPWVKTVLQAALLNQSKNPIVPSSDQIALMNQARHVRPDNTDLLIVWACTEWQRVMFLEQEPEIRPFVKSICHQFRGVTLTTSEAKYIKDHVSSGTHDSNPKSGSQ